MDRRGKHQRKACTWVMVSQNVYTTLEGTLKTISSRHYFAVGETEARKHKGPDRGLIVLCSRVQARVVTLASWSSAGPPDLTRPVQSPRWSPRTQVHAADPSRTRNAS